MRFFKYFLITLVFTLFSSFADARAGGGGGGGGGVRGRVSRWFFPACLVGLVYLAYANYKIHKKKKKIQAALTQIAAREPEWNELSILNFTRVCFFETQLAWGENDLEKLSKILHPSLFSVWSSQIEILKKTGERDVLEEPGINNLRIVDVKNFYDDEKDEFTVCIDARGRDIRYRGERIAYRGRFYSFREFWTFEKEGQSWALKDVAHAIAWMRFVTSPIIYEPSSSRKKLS